MSRPSALELTPKTKTTSPLVQTKKNKLLKWKSITFLAAQISDSSHVNLFSVSIFRIQTCFAKLFFNLSDNKYNNNT